MGFIDFFLVGAIGFVAVGLGATLIIGATLVTERLSQ